eukprot:SAG31_NODE_5421_length_2547_cov_12.100899_2_plen_386_part_00
MAEQQRQHAAQMQQQQEITQALLARLATQPTAPQMAGTRPAQQAQPEAAPTRTATSTNVQPTLGQSTAIQKKIEEHVSKYTQTLNQLNSAKASHAALSKLEISADPAVPLPQGTPKEAKALTAPEIRVHAAVKILHERQNSEAQRRLATHIRAAQIEFVKQMTGSKEATVQHLQEELPRIANHLETAVAEILADTLISEHVKQELQRTAAAKYAAEMNAATIKVETKRKADIAEKQRRAAELEKAKIQQLERDNSQTVGALIDQKIAAERERTRRGSMEIDEPRPDDQQLMEENADFEKRHTNKQNAKAAPAQKQGNGKASRQPLGPRGQNKANQQQQKQTQTKKKKGKDKGKDAKQKNSKPKGKGAKGKGKGKSKHAAGKGGRS